MMNHKAVIDLNPGLLSAPGRSILPRPLPRRVVAPAGGKWRGYSQKPPGHAMVGHRAQRTSVAPARDATESEHSAAAKDSSSLL
jgi:hypothetical protein